MGGNVKQTFEDFLMEQHAKSYVGTKDTMVDDSADWLTNLSPDEFIEYGDKFAKEQSKDLLEACKKAKQFIENGWFGYIQLPEKGDTALQTLPAIDQAIAKAEEE